MICAAMYTPAIIASMRRAARNPIVTAGLKCPEMRINALTNTARMTPWASATAMSPDSIRVACAAMIEAPPTNTSAKVPTNSATKWRRESFIGRRGEGRKERSIRTLQHHGGVDAAKTKGVAQRVLHRPLPARAGDVVEVAPVPGRVEVQRRGQPAALERHRRNRDLERA